MHIAQFVHRYPPALGGAEAYTARLCNYLAHRGDSIRVWTSSAIQLEEMWGQPREDSNLLPGEESRDGRNSSIRISRYRPLTFPGRRYFLKALSLVPHRNWQCLTVPCNPICPQMWTDTTCYYGPLDAVHATAFPYSFPIVCALRLARRNAVPFFLTPFLHLGDFANPNDRTRQQYTRPHLRWLLQQADGVFVQTQLEFEAVISLGVPEGRVYLQGLGVESSECTNGDRESLRRTWSVTDDEVVIGHLANNSIEKGTCDLLKAAGKLWQQGKRFRVVLAGPQMKNFQLFWDQFQPKSRVIQLGVLTDEAKRDFFAAIDAFALPSVTDSFGLVLLEAWANSKSNLVYRAGGPGELVRDGVDGLQARCGDVEELSTQLSRLVSDSELRLKLGERGQRRIACEFQWKDKLELVREVLARAKANIKRSAMTPHGSFHPLLLELRS